MTKNLILLDEEFVKNLILCREYLYMVVQKFNIA